MNRLAKRRLPIEILAAVSGTLDVQAREPGVILTASEILPRPALDPAGLTSLCPPTKKTVRWITSIDGHAMSTDYMRRVDGADPERRSAQPPRN